MALATSTIGFPRIGPNREMKKVLESFWKKETPLAALEATAAEIEGNSWELQAKAGISFVGLDGTLYDQVLDWTFYLGLVPDRFKHLTGLDLYFAMARGAEGCTALDMSKFFDTNYHYMVPELDEGLVASARPDFSRLVEKVKRGQAAIGKAAAVPIIIGPNTLVGLAKSTAEDALLNRSALVQALTPAYVQVLQQLKELGVPEVQIHEPILTTETAAGLADTFKTSFGDMAAVGVPINLVTYYDDIGDAYPWVIQLPVQAISLDFLGVPGSAHGCATAALIEKYGFPADKRLGAGVVDGRSVWADGDTPAAIVAALLGKGIKNVCVQSSVSLQHLPYDTALETALPTDIAARLSFATQKLGELVSAARTAPTLEPTSLAEAVPTVGQQPVKVDPRDLARGLPYEERRGKQIQTSPFPTSSIGSFPQTPELRRARLQFNKGALSGEAYKAVVEDYMRFAIAEQERLGVDVLVHGEPERTDMVEFFGQRLDGFCFTTAGWVQSYGSRYVRPPIIHADVVRSRGAMTVSEFAFAQSLTKKPVKGMLTGPVTILNWSFPRKDVSRQVQAVQLAQALRAEVADLEAAGCRVIQVDEPALREGLPLKRARWASYLAWAVDAFRLATTVAAPATQIVTHLCYSEFGDILAAIDGLDADVLTIENSRSGNEMVRALAKYGYARDIGPGVYDVHSPVVPSVEFMKEKIASFVEAGIQPGRPDRIWVNPDCGLKTREWGQVLPALDNMVHAAAAARAELVKPN